MGEWGGREGREGGCRSGCVGEWGGRGGRGAAGVAAWVSGEGGEGEGLQEWLRG